MKVIINAISINQRTNNIFSEEEIDIELLKYLYLLDLLSKDLLKSKS
jgi:hypothetical protein